MMQIGRMRQAQLVGGEIHGEKWIGPAIGWPAWD
jgi:hypothetical protein